LTYSDLCWRRFLRETHARERLERIKYPPPFARLERIVGSTYLLLPLPVQECLLTYTIALVTGSALAGLVYLYKLRWWLLVGVLLLLLTLAATVRLTHLRVKGRVAVAKPPTPDKFRVSVGEATSTRGLLTLRGGKVAPQPVKRQGEKVVPIESQEFAGDSPVAGSLRTVSVAPSPTSAPITDQLPEIEAPAVILRASTTDTTAKISVAPQSPSLPVEKAPSWAPHPHTLAPLRTRPQSEAPSAFDSPRGARPSLASLQPHHTPEPAPPDSPKNRPPIHLQPLSFPSRTLQAPTRLLHSGRRRISSTPRGTSATP
jgi:hypothetical protein